MKWLHIEFASLVSVLIWHKFQGSDSFPTDYHVSYHSHSNHKHESESSLVTAFLSTNIF